MRFSNSMKLAQQRDRHCNGWLAGWLAFFWRRIQSLRKCALCFSLLERYTAATLLRQMVVVTTQISELSTDFVEFLLNTFGRTCLIINMWSSSYNSSLIIHQFIHLSINIIFAGKCYSSYMSVYNQDPNLHFYEVFMNFNTSACID